MASHAGDPADPEADVELTLEDGEPVTVENTSDRTIVVAAPTRGTFDAPEQGDPVANRSHPRPCAACGATIPPGGTCPNPDCWMKR